MALKKKKKPKSEKEQLYMLEILIDSLDLCPEKSVNGRECDMMICIGFIDLTPIDIILKNHTEVKGGRSKNKENRFLDECNKYKGKTCLFAQTPSNLMRSMKSTPLSIEVYRIPRGENRNLRDEHTLLCAAAAFPSESFCDQVTAAKNKIDGLSKPCTVMETYTLANEQGKPCGSVSMYLRLSCFGSSIIDHLTLREKSYVFQGFPLDWKFHRAKLHDKDTNETSRIKYDDNVLFDKILGSAYSKLHDHTDAAFVLTRPESPPRVSMEQPEFEKLTSAEKLNDRKYRGLIYDMYPDEPTCSCPPSDRPSHPMICRSGCTRSCCMALRNPDILRNYSDDGRSLATLTDDANNLDPTMKRSTAGSASRMRGGGREDTGLDNEALWDDEYTWRKGNLMNRTAGGSDYDKSAYPPSEAATTIIYQKGKEPNVGSSHRSHPRSEVKAAAANCVCPGKETSSWRAGTKCSKKPCVGADCLIRAFKEAQAFVDSIGKVPGMVGLGLMDPSESPYFGRDIDKDYPVHETPSERKLRYPVPLTAVSPSVLLCTAPCNTLIDKSILSSASLPYAFPMAVPERIGVVRDAKPMLPSVAVKSKKKEDKKEEKAEKQKDDISTIPSQDIVVGPCGEPKCKSRPKVPGNNRTVPREKVEEPQKLAVKSQPPSTITARSLKSIERARQLKSKLGPEGDRDIVRGPIKVSKRVMRYVHSIGDVYPGIHYGHKNCIDPRLRVPANMGWLWNTSTTIGKLKPRIGWKPGAISRYLNELLKAAKGISLMEDSRSRSVPSRTGLRRGKVFKTLSYVSQTKKEGEEEAEPPPTLHIHRKDGTYYVTMYPIKPETTDVAQLEEPMKPLQFKIVKSKDDASVASSSTASDMEIEFSPPAAVSRYRRKPDVIHVDTQVRQQEILEAFQPTEPVPKKKERKGRRERRGRK
ncbi:hypothetical protein DMN91_012775 [Ooceraea biroi]|uniref:DUF4776 domain-containing protein n=1 Tax=Ooceraea biroi TaxID=2015173 RepID=A0A026W4L2_OOCBI|nr:uncharacterized protein LOC113563342 [Ooceraea biroi]EZA50963.1 hypothetical protein X777_10591 [Ooceraea biroi]RLU14888.1 hypothetical protein DMN91_012775 [Ooceraea biroi]